MLLVVMMFFSRVVCLCTMMFASSVAVDQAELFNSAVQLHSVGKLDASIKKMAKCCHKGGDIAAQACFNAAVYLSESQNFVESSKFFRLSIEHDSRNALAHSNLGVTYQYLGDFASALGSYESSLKLDPKSAMTYFNIGKVNQELGRTMEAIHAFEHAVSLKPDYFEAYATLGGAFTPLRDWAKSAMLLRDALKLQPDSVEGLYLLLYAEMQMCSWPVTTQLMRMIRPLIAQRLRRNERPGMEAYASLTMPWTLLEQTRIAASFARTAALNVQHLPALPLHDGALSKLRVVFKSYDFADHMSLYLIIEAMEMLAARQDIVAFAFSVRGDDGSSLVRRLRDAFAARYVCVAEFDSYTAAAKINQRKPHIMVDLDGHFRNSRFAVFFCCFPRRSEFPRPRALSLLVVITLCAQPVFRLEISALRPAPHQMRQVFTQCKRPTLAHSLNFFAAGTLCTWVQPPPLTCPSCSPTVSFCPLSSLQMCQKKWCSCRTRFTLIHIRLRSQCPSLHRVCPLTAVDGICQRVVWLCLITTSSTSLTDFHFTPCNLLGCFDICNECCNFCITRRCISAAISFEGGAGRGTLWLKSETAAVHSRLSTVTAAFVMHYFCSRHACNGRLARVSWAAISALELCMRIGLQGRMNT